MAETRFITPLDVLFLRGNRLFGEAGQHGEAQMPPWPSVLAGAIRSRMLAEAGIDLGAFANGQKPPAPLGDALGTPDFPGSFRIAWFSLARRIGTEIEPILPPPADLFAEEGSETLLYLNPQRLSDRLQSSYSTPHLPILRQQKGNKPEDGRWMNGAGLALYLRGELLKESQHTVARSALWRTEPRLGIALDPKTRTAEEGRLYTTEGVALVSEWGGVEAKQEVGFLARIEGAEGLVPADGLVRLGGDGRGARIDRCDMKWPEPDWEGIERDKRFQLMLTTPGLFEKGWFLPGLAEDGTWNGPDGLTAKIVSAAVPRAQVVSGWDLAKWRPKPALRAAPPGSVYWLEAPEMAGSTMVRALQRLMAEGFGCIEAYPDKSRLAEGFNNVMVANWAAG